jgi:hypothetical protein
VQEEAPELVNEVHPEGDPVIPLLATTDHELNTHPLLAVETHDMS